MLHTIDGAAFRRMVISAAAAVEIQKQRINELNVFPVPDGDTGTNMSMTLNAAATDLKKNPDGDLSKISSVVSNALLRGARGNSGVILSLLFRGFSKVFKGEETADGAQFAAALSSGVEAAYKAVMKPAEGTILTVSRVSAAAAQEEAKENNDVEHILEFLIEACKTAVAETVEQNPVLKKAGVVDAGGQGFLVALEGMLASLQGNDLIAPEVSADAVQEEADFSDFSTEDITFGYCTEFIVNRENDKDPEALRPFLNGLGDSLVLVADEEIIKVHVHTNHPGLVIEEALTYGGLATSKIENMRLQHTEKVMSQAEAAEANKPVKPEKTYGVVSVCAGEGLAAVFRDLGVDGIIQGGQTMNPSTEDILKQIRTVPAETVFVLPNNKNIIMAAQQAAAIAEQNVVVIESKTVPQGITAMLNFDPEGQVDAIAEAMTASLSTVSTMMVTYAARNSDFDGHDIHEGDYLAMYNGALLATGPDMNELICKLAEKAKEEDKEFINVFYGEGVDEAQATEVASIFENSCTGAEVTVLNGGQPVYYYMISAE